MSIRWFGGPGQRPGVCEVPLETFQPALDFLAGEHKRLAVLGTSKGAEAAMLLAANDPRISVVAALSPSSVIWANVGAGLDGESYPYRSSWTHHGRPVPFVPYDETWIPDSDPPAYLRLYQQSLRAFPAQVAQAAIPVDRITAEVLLAAVTDDQVWPSAQFVNDIVTRRANHGLQTRFVIQDDAGHAIRLPGEPAPTGGIPMARGGSRDLNSRLGEHVWQQLQQLLPLR